MSASGPVDIILSNLAGAEWLEVGLSVECLVEVSGFWITSAGTSELDEGREISELDGEGGSSKFEDEEGHSSVVDDMAVGSLESFSDMIDATEKKSLSCELFWFTKSTTVTMRRCPIKIAQIIFSLFPCDIVKCHQI